MEQSEGQSESGDDKRSPKGSGDAEERDRVREPDKKLKVATDEPSGELQNSPAISRKERQKSQIEKARKDLGETLVRASVIEDNMQEIDGFKAQTPNSAEGKVSDSVELAKLMALNLSRVPDRKKIVISDTLPISQAQKLSNVLLGEINRRRRERGEPTVESEHNPDKPKKIETLNFSVEDVDIVQLSEGVVKSTDEYPREVPDSVNDNGMWGRVNILKNEGVNFGYVRMQPASVDGFVHWVVAQRHLYKGGQLVGEWEQELYYSRPSGKNDSPKRLSSYEEETRDKEGKPVENVNVKFNNDGYVIMVSKTQYENGQKSGGTEMAYEYDSDGKIRKSTKSEIDREDNKIKSEDVSNPVGEGRESGVIEQPEVKEQEPATEIHTGNDRTTGAVSDHNVTRGVDERVSMDKEESSGVLGKIGRFFGR